MSVVLISPLAVIFPEEFRFPAEALPETLSVVSVPTPVIFGCEAVVKLPAILVALNVFDDLSKVNEDDPLKLPSSLNCTNVLLPPGNLCTTQLRLPVPSVFST